MKILSHLCTVCLPLLSLSLPYLSLLSLLPLPISLPSPIPYLSLFSYLSLSLSPYLSPIFLPPFPLSPSSLSLSLSLLISPFPLPPL